MARRLAIAGLLLFGGAVPATAHPAPFSYIDVGVAPSQITVTVVAHLFDVGHDLGVDQQDLLNPVVLSSRREDIVRLIAARLSLSASGRIMQLADWSEPELLSEREALRLTA